MRRCGKTAGSLRQGRGAARLARRTGRPRSGAEDLRVMLMLRDVVAGPGGCRPLHGVTMKADDAGITAVIGRNGAGKSALANTVGGLLPVISGQVLFGGYDITGAAVKERVALGIRYLPSGRQLFAGMTLLENLQLGAARSAPGEFARGLDFVLTLFPELQSMLG